MERTLSQKLLAEFVGAFTLIFIGAGAVISANATGGAGALGLVGIALAYGLAIGVMVSALGHVSGGHFNPAVTIGAWVTQKLGSMEALTYVVAQVLGAIAAAGVLRAALPKQLWEQQPSKLGSPLVSSGLGVSNGQAVLIEAVLTFFLVWVVFGTAMDPEGSFGKIAGLAIGFVITMDVLMGGPLTGAAMNPARSIGPAVVGGVWEGWWVYWVGPIAGGIVAASLYDSGILRPRVGFGSAAEHEVSHGIGAHGDEEPLSEHPEETHGEHGHLH